MFNSHGNLSGMFFRILRRTNGVAFPRKDMVGGMFKTAVVREIEEDKQEVEAIVSNGLFYHCVAFL